MVLRRWSVVFLASVFGVGSVSGVVSRIRNRFVQTMWEKKRRMVAKSRFSSLPGGSNMASRILRLESKPPPGGLTAGGRKHQKIQMKLR